MFIKGVPPIIFALFIGPWSDNRGRKVLILLPIIGFILNYICFCINTVYYEELTVEYLMFEVIANWFGGWTCFFLGIYSYISDVSSPKSRAVRIGILDCTLSVAIAIALGNSFISITKSIRNLDFLDSRYSHFLRYICAPYHFRHFRKSNNSFRLSYPILVNNRCGRLGIHLWCYSPERE